MRLYQSCTSLPCAFLSPSRARAIRASECIMAMSRRVSATKSSVQVVFAIKMGDRVKKFYRIQRNFTVQINVENQAKTEAFETFLNQISIVKNTNPLCYDSQSA